MKLEREKSEILKNFEEKRVKKYKNKKTNKI